MILAQRKIIILFFIIITCFSISAPFLLAIFKNSSPENRLLIDVIDCRIKKCTEIYADFHDYGGLKKIPSFIAFAESVENTTFIIYELKSISALTGLDRLKTLNISGISGIPQEEILALQEKGINVLW